MAAVKLTAVAVVALNTNLLVLVCLLLMASLWLNLLNTMLYMSTTLFSSFSSVPLLSSTSLFVSTKTYLNGSSVVV